MPTLKHRIMFRVYVLWAFRLLKRPLAAEMGAFALLLGTLAFTVSIPSIIMNALGSANAYAYLIAAFSHTDHLAQLLLFIVSLAALYVARNLVPQKLFKLRFVRLVRFA